MPLHRLPDGGIDGLQIDLVEPVRVYPADYINLFSRQAICSGADCLLLRLTNSWEIVLPGRVRARRETS